MENEDIKLRSISCNEAEKSFNDLIDGYLKGKTKKELEHHIAHCLHCFGRIEFEKKLKEKLRSAATDINLTSVRKRIFNLLENK